MYNLVIDRFVELWHTSIIALEYATGTLSRKISWYILVNYPYLFEHLQENSSLVNYKSASDGLMHTISATGESSYSSAEIV